MRAGFFAVPALFAVTAAAGAIPTPDRPVTNPRAIISEKNLAAVPISAAEAVSSPSVTDMVWSADDKTLFLATSLSGRVNIWKMDSGGGWPIRLTQSEEWQSGLVSTPDGKSLLYVQDTGGDESYDIYSVPTGGGPPVNLTNSPEVAENGIKISPDGSKIAFSYKPKSRSQRDIAVMDLATRTVRTLTHETDVQGVWSVAAWTSDSKGIVANREQTALGGDATIWKIDVASGERVRLVTPREGGRDLAAGITPDGKWLAVSSNLGSTQLRAALYDIIAKKYRWLAPTPWEQNVVALSPNGHSMLVRTWENGRVTLSIVDVPSMHQRVLPVPPGVNEAIGWWPWSRDTQPFSHTSNKLVFGHASGDSPTDIRVADLSTFQIKRVAQFAPANLVPGKLPRQQMITYRSFDGTLVSAVLTTPYNLARDASNPALVMPHGGPTAASSDGFNPEAAFLASHGYMVIQPNFRGSTGYGAKFQDAERHDMGGGDLQDVIAAKPFLVSTGYVDANKVGITGGSGGGWLTMLALGKHPDAFAAGVQKFGVIDWYTFLKGTDPFVRTYIESLIGDPQKDRARYLSASPSSYISQIKAPLLSLQGENDIRVPVQQAIEVRDALKKQGTPSETIIYKGEGHGFAKRETKIDALERTLEWFDRYLRSEPPGSGAGSMPQRP
jgi:dipeptidyl aminopeptidase/acylaminoacyl peptidase